MQTQWGGCAWRVEAAEPTLLGTCLISAVPVSWLENTCDSLVIFWSFIASFFILYAASQEKLKREQEVVWKQQSPGLLEKEFDSGSNHFDHVRFTKWWCEMENQDLTLVGIWTFFLHVPGSRGSLWVNWNHCESMHKLRCSSSIRGEVSGCSAQRSGAMLTACRGKITHTAAAGPRAVARSSRFSPASASVPGKVGAVPNPTAGLCPAAVGREWGCAWSLHWSELHVETVLFYCSLY